MPGNDPVVGISVGYAEHNNAPATAASPEPIANVIDIVAFTFMSCAAPLSSEHAHIAFPIFVLLMNNDSTTIITTHATIVRAVICETDKFPSNNLNDPRPMIDGKTLGFDDHNKSAVFWRK